MHHMGGTPLPAAEDEEGIHLKPGRNTGFEWSNNNGAGSRWDISNSGQVDDGSNDAYDGGMMLYVNNSNFFWGQAGRASQDNREVEMGPWNANGLQVSRRIYVDPKLGYCRWIDIFENPSGGEINANIRYMSNIGGSIQMIESSTGAASVGDKDWGLITGSQGNSSRPSTIHVFCSKDNKVRPQVQARLRNSQMTYTFNLKVPAGKAVALAVFEAPAVEPGRFPEVPQAVQSPAGACPRPAGLAEDHPQRGLRHPIPGKH